MPKLTNLKLASRARRICKSTTAEIGGDEIEVMLLLADRLKETTKALRDMTWIFEDYAADWDDNSLGVKVLERANLLKQ